MTWSVGAGLDGRGVVVTGAAGGVGRAVATALAAAEARVLAVDVDQNAADEVVAGLPGSGHVAASYDVSLPEAPDTIVAQALAELGSIYALVNVAAVLHRRNDIGEVSLADWDHQQEVNVRAAFFLCRAAADAMVDQGRGGRLITFASQGWWTGGFGGSVAYAATKGAVVSMTRGLARTYGPHGITANTVAPGMIDTPMLREGLEPNVHAEMLRQTPLGRVGEPDEIAGPVVFLASDHARYISGATINVSGGFLMY